MIYALGKRRPEIADDVFVAPNAQVIGTVSLGPQASVWFGAVLRGDTEQITVGAKTNIQDNAVLHADPGFPCTLGVGVTVGHLAMVHGCTVGDHSLIGIGAVVLNGAKIGSHCVIGANAMIPEGKVIPDGSLVLGTPGRVVKELPEASRMGLHLSAEAYVAKARSYLEGLEPLA